MCLCASASMLSLSLCWHFWGRGQVYFESANGRFEQEQHWERGICRVLMCGPLSFCVGDTIFMPFKAHYDIALPVKEFLAGTFTSNSRRRLALPSSSSFVVAGTHSAVLTTETQADGERGASLSQIPDLMPKTWLSFPTGRLWAPTLILDDFEKEYWLT